MVRSMGVKGGWFFLILAICQVAAPAEAANVWTSIGLDGGEILSLAADPQKAGVLYAGTWQGVFKSTDGGATWVRSSEGLRRRAVSELAVSPWDSSLVYSSGEGGIHVSRDAGATWTPTLGWAYTTSVAVDPHNPRRVWSTNIDFLDRSDDAGATWKNVHLNINVTHLRDVAVDPFRPDTLYLASLEYQNYGVSQILKSTDAGKTWVRIAGELEPGSRNADIVLDPTTPGLLYVAFDVSTWRSTDGGATWHRTDGGGIPTTVDRQGVVYADEMLSTDHGQTWQKVTELPAPILCYATGDGTVWTGTYGFGVFRSRDRAATWEPASRGLHATTVTSFVIDPGQPRVIYAAAERVGLFKTLSTGAAWRRVDSGLPPEINDPSARKTLAIDPQHPQTIYLGWTTLYGSGSGGIARSDDGGEHWTLLREPDDTSFFITHLAVDPTAANIIYAIGSGVGAPGEPCSLARSTDRGTTFKCVPPFKNNTAAWKLTPDPTTPGTLWILVGRPGRFWKSTDHGAHWTAIQPRELKNAGVPLSLAFDPTQARRMFLGTDAGTGGDPYEPIWRSDNGGLSWRPSGRGLPPLSRVTQVLIDPQQPNIFYAAVYDNQYASSISDRSGVYWSRDGGKTFRSAGLTGNVLQLTQDPKNPRKLYASVEGRGIYIWTRP